MPVIHHQITCSVLPRPDIALFFLGAFFVLFFLFCFVFLFFLLNEVLFVLKDFSYGHRDLLFNGLDTVIIWNNNYNNF